MTPAQRKAAIAAAQRDSWLRGDLRHLLDSNQRVAYDAFKMSKRSRFVMEWARRAGKTYLLAVLAIEVCLSGKHRRVVYGASTIKDLTEFIIPTIEKICEDAPRECRPRWDAQKGHFTFPNGSYIHVFGCDNKTKANRGRGPGADLVIVDEAGFVPVLRHVLRSVLRPQTLTTGGKTLLASTPAEEPDHDFTKIAETAESNGNYLRRTIYDNPRLTKEQIQKFIEDDARDEGMTVEEYVKTDTFRREYMAERVTDRMLTVVPEWEDKRDQLFVAVDRPEYFDGTVALDFGGYDPHAALFGYFDFKSGDIVIEDEVFLREGENSADVAKAVKDKERALWGVDLWDGTLRAAQENHYALVKNLPEFMQRILHVQGRQQPWIRWCDNNIQLCRDLFELHQLAFVPTPKDQKMLQVNNLRVLIRQGGIKINPRCINLDRHLRTTTWQNERRLDFKRKTAPREHGDLLDALIYFTRNVDRQKNPYPVNQLHGDEWLARQARLQKNQGLSIASFMPNTRLGRRLAGKYR